MIKFGQIALHYEKVGIKFNTPPSFVIFKRDAGEVLQISTRYLITNLLVNFLQRKKVVPFL